MTGITEDPTTWPPPNYVDPANQTAAVIGSVIPLTLLMNFFWIGRIVGRKVVKSALGLDDWIMSVAAILANACCITGCISLKYGLGYHIWDIKESWQVPYARIQLGWITLWQLTIPLVKLSIAISYLRLFPSTLDRAFSFGMIAYSIGYAIAIPLVSICACNPIAKAWHPTIEGYCVDLTKMVIATGVFNVLSDFVVFLWPARVLWNVQIPRKQRIGLIIMFSFGVIVCAVGVLRMWSIVQEVTHWDITWGAAPAQIFTCVEVSTGVTCGCIPCMKPFLGLLFPNLIGSSHDDSHDHGRSSTSRSGIGAGRHGASRKPSSQDFPFQTLDGGEASKKTAPVAVQVNPADEISSDDDLVAGPGASGSHYQRPDNHVWAQANGEYARASRIPDGQIGVDLEISVSVDDARLGPRKAHGDQSSEEFMIEGPT